MMKTEKNSYLPIFAALLTIILAVLVVFLASYVNNLDSGVALIQADRELLAETPEDLAEVSDIIVLARLKDSENVLITDPFDGCIITGYQESTLEIVEVYKGNISGEIVVTEECYYSDDEDTLWTQQGYLPMEKNYEYILFLTAYSDDSMYAGMYFPTDLEHGKYVVTKSGSGDVATATKSDLQIGAETNKNDYVEWYQCAMETVNTLKQSDLTENIGNAEENYVGTE